MFRTSCIFGRCWSPKRVPKMLQKGRHALIKITFSPNLIRFCISVHMLCDFHSIFSRFWLKFGSIWCHSGSNLVAISHRRCRFRTANLDLLFFKMFKQRADDRERERDKKQTEEMPPELNVPQATQGSGGMRGAFK